jgi:hypothetical protein
LERRFKRKAKDKFQNIKPKDENFRNIKPKDEILKGNTKNRK